jgi:hypothetical protein
MDELLRVRVFKFDLSHAAMLKHGPPKNLITGFRVLQHLPRFNNIFFWRDALLRVRGVVFVAAIS